MLEHKKKGRLRCHRRPKSREETPKEGSDSGVGLGGRYRIPLAKTIASSGSIERKGSRTDTKVYGARRLLFGPGHLEHRPARRGIHVLAGVHKTVARVEANGAGVVLVY